MHVEIKRRRVELMLVSGINFCSKVVGPLVLLE